MGFQPKHLTVPLASGGAFHDGKAEYYLTWSMDKGLKELKESFLERAEMLDDEVDRGKVLHRLRIMFASWVDDIGKNDEGNYKIIEVEKEWKIKFPNGFVATARPDAVVQNRKTGVYYIFETKTSSFSVGLALQTVLLGDQATMYSYGFKQRWPNRKFGGVIPDITYWNSRSTDTAKIINYREDIVRRTPYELKAFELYTMAVLEDLAGRVRAVEDGVTEPIVAFGPNRSWCFSYHHTCEYADICGKDLRPDDVPNGFVRDPWRTEDDVTKLQNAFDLRRYTDEQETRRVLHATKTGEKKVQGRDGSIGDVNRRRPYGGSSLYNLPIHERKGWGQRVSAVDLSRTDSIHRLLRSWVFARLNKAERDAIISAL